MFRGILEHEASVHWRTSKTANQNFNLINKFLRCTGLLDCDSLPSFRNKISGLKVDDVTSMCQTFTDRFCATAASARRYAVVLNHIFHRVWGVVPKRCITPVKRKRIHTLGARNNYTFDCSVAERAR